MNHQSAALACALLAAGRAAAQDAPAAPPAAAVADASLADVTVTGQRQPYLGDAPLKRLPQDVQLLDAATLKRAGITTLQNALDFVAGAARQNSFGGLFDAYAIRGFAGDEGLASNYLLNGFNASRGFGGPRDASGIERIEVVKGPTSALFGRGDPGGVVNIVTKKSFFGRGGYLEASGGSFARRRVEGDVDTAIGGTVAARITGAYDEGDSFRALVDHRTFALAPSVLWRPDAATSVTYKLDWLDQRIPLDRGVVSLNGRLGVVPRDRFLAEPGDGPVALNALGHQVQLQHDFEPGWSLLIGGSYRGTGLAGFATEPENADARQRLFVDGRTLSRQRRYRDFDTGDTTFRAELAGVATTVGVEHHFQVGADWDYLRIDQQASRFRPPAVARQTTLAAGDAVDIFQPVYGTLPAVAPFLSTLEKDEEVGVYVQDRVEIAPWLSLRAGGRFDHFAQRFADRLAGRMTYQSADAFSPQAGISVLPVRDLTLYAGYGKGFRPNSGADASASAFVPERTESFEIGAKLSALDGRLLGTIAAFTMTRTNVLTADPINAGFSVAIGRARSRGVEASLTGALPLGLRGVLNYAYTDAVVGRNGIDPNFGFALREGDPLINIPRHSASAILSRPFAVAGHAASIGVTANYVGRRVGQTGFRFADGSLFTLPSYAIAGANASFDLTRRLRVQIDVNNILDATWYPSSYSRVWVTPGAPRQAMARVRYGF